MSKAQQQQQQQQPKKTQLHLDFGQKHVGAVTCPRCNMVYMSGADEEVHRKHCGAIAAQNAVQGDPEAAFNAAFFSKFHSSSSASTVQQKSKQSGGGSSGSACFQFAAPCARLAEEYFPGAFITVLSPVPEELLLLLASMEHLNQATQSDGDEHGVSYRPAHYYAAASKIPIGASLVVFAFDDGQQQQQQRRVLGVCLFSTCKRFVPTAVLDGEREGGGGNSNSASGDDDGSRDGRSPSPAPFDAESQPLRVRGVNVQAAIWDASLFPSAFSTAAAMAQQRKKKATAPATPSVASFFGGGGGGNAALAQIVNSAGLGAKSKPGGKSAKKSPAAAVGTKSISSFFRPQIRQREEDVGASKQQQQQQPEDSELTANVSKVFFSAVLECVCIAMRVGSSFSRQAFSFSDHLIEVTPARGCLPAVLQMLNREVTAEAQAVVIARLTPRVMGFATLDNELETNEALADEKDPYFRVRWM